MSYPHKTCWRRAFTLVELLVVMMIIVIVTTLAVPAITTLLRGSGITRAAEIVTGQFKLARQRALTKNRLIELRLYRCADPEAGGEAVADKLTWKFRNLQIFEINESGVSTPIDKVQRLPHTVLINPDVLSSLVKDPAQVVTDPSVPDPELPRGVGKNYQYVTLRFRPDGSTDLPVKSTSDSNGAWFLTIHNLTDKIKDNKPPPNFFTLSIDPVSGTTKGYRPMAP